MRFARHAALLAQHRRSSPWWLAGGVDPSNTVWAYQPKGAADLATSYINLASPDTYDAAPGVAPTHAPETGWYTNGSKWLSTGYVLPASQTHSLVVRFAGCTVNNDVHALVATYPGLSIYNDAGNVIAFTLGISQITSAPGMTDGVLGVAGRDCFKNGVYLGTTSESDRAPSASPINLLGLPDYGQMMIGYMYAAALYSTIITADQQLAITEAVNDL